LVGINHVALEVAGLDAAVEWYGRILELEFREQFERMAFIDIGDQFLALAEVGGQDPDRVRHFGLVVDDKETTRRRLEQVGAEIPDTRGLEFLDPWGNRVQVVDYRI
jgi:catechol 2,3-dioxygenase-like lactoylglutathione lyase family enzyme